jgi:pantoate--beta-alanine ligase
MQIVKDPDAMQALRRSWTGSVGFVPTMGALHDGHLSLVRAARAADAIVVASIFVNPAQFGPAEDFDRYPRRLDQDAALLRSEGVDALFIPGTAQMYPLGYATFVEVDGLANRLCGRSRPGHFRGVATVVAKLFCIVRPDRAYFGQKDAAQIAVLRRMTADLNLGVELRVCPIVRDSDGLALSSRNAYLSAAERLEALALSQALAVIARAVADGEADTGVLLNLGRDVIARHSAVKLDYFEAVDADSLLPRAKVEPNTLFAVAAFVGNTRLIDNLLLDGDGSTGR